MVVNHKDNETSREYIIKELKEVDSTLRLFDDVIELIDQFDFYMMIRDLEDQKKAYHIKNGRKPRDGAIQNLLFNILINSFLKYCAIDKDTLYIFKEDEGWSKTCHRPIKQLNLLINAIFKNELDFKQQDLFNNKMIQFITFGSDNDVIQFNNCYIKDGELYEGFYENELAQYRINQYIDNHFEIDLKEPVEELLLHLSNDDNETKQRLLDDLSMCLCNNHQFIQKNGKFIRFYGPTGENGKSTLFSVLMKALGESNVTSFNTSQLRSYELEYVTKSLVAFDSDEDGSRWNSEVSRNIKLVVTADQLPVRQIYSNPTEITPITTLISATNNLPKTEDKSNGLTRRLDWFYIKNKLIKDQDWFDRLYSDESINYLINLLYSNYKSLLSRGKIVIKSQQMINTEKMFNESNNSAYSFILSITKDDILNHTVRDIKNQYKEYCEENDLKELGPSKFNPEIVKAFGVEQKSVKYKKIEVGIHDHHAFENKVDNSNKTVKAWVEN